MKDSKELRGDLLPDWNKHPGMISSFSRHRWQRRFEEPQRTPSTQRNQCASEFAPIPEQNEALAKKIIRAAIEVYRSLDSLVNLVCFVVGKMQRKFNPVR
jgi:hypothetical protein